MFAEPADLSSLQTSTAIGHAARPEAMFAAERPDAIWLVDGDRITEVDGSGRVLIGPVHLPGFSDGLAVSDGVVVTVGNLLEVWNPASGATMCRLPESAFLIAAHRDQLAWMDRSGALHLTRAGACDDRPVALAATDRVVGGFFDGPGAFSPDGKLLACYVASSANDDVSLLLVDIVAGRMIRIAPFLSDGSAPMTITFAPDGLRVFWTETFPEGRTPRLLTERLGQEPEVVRYPDLPVLIGLQVLPTGR